MVVSAADEAEARFIGSWLATLAIAPPLLLGLSGRAHCTQIGLARWLVLVLELPPAKWEWHSSRPARRDSPVPCSCHWPS